MMRQLAGKLNAKYSTAPFLENKIKNLGLHGVVLLDF